MSQTKNLWIVCIVMSLFISVSSWATTYYVDPNGDNDANGLTLQTSWLTIQKAADTMVAGDTVYIKAGTYNEQVTIASSGTSSLPIVFEGYKDTPGDNPSFTDFQYDDAVDPNVMPVLDGGDRALDQIGIYVYTPWPDNSEYITIRNIQITRYKVGLKTLGANYVTLDNVIARDFGVINDPNPLGGTGILLESSNNHNTIKNCIVVNATAENYSITGDNNLIDNCQSYCDDNRTGRVSATDYYMVIIGDYNVVKNCYVERVGNLAHNGHGIHCKADSQYNIIKDCQSRNLGSCFKARYRGAKYNTFENCTAWGTSEDPATVEPVRGFVCVDGASYNTFKNCRAIGTHSGVFFCDGDEDDGAQYAGSNNTFENCLFEDIIDAAIDFNHWQYQTDADNNSFKKCVISGCNMLFRGERPNQDNLMSDCAVLNTGYFNQTWDSIPDTFTVYDVDCAFTFTNFSDNGFGDCSTVARFRFDSSSNNTTTDSSWKENDGTLMNGVSQSSSGVKEGALEFDGVDGYVDAGSGSSLELDEFTYSVWIKPSSLTSGDRCIIGKNSMWRKGLSITNDLLRGYVRHDDVGAITKCYGVITTDWQHVAMTYSNGEVKLYRNGQLLSPDYATTGSGDLTSTAAYSLCVSNPTNPFDGLIDEVYIYPVALDDDAVFKTYIEQSSACHFSLDDGIGVSTIDSISGDYASLSGGPVWFPSDGVDGGALEFDGVDGYVDAGSGSSLELDEFTYSVWIKPSSLTSGDRCIIGKNSMWRKGLSITNDLLRGYVRHDDVGAITKCYGVITTDWQHVAMTYSNGEVKLYRNGQLLSPDYATTGSGDLTSTAAYSLCVSNPTNPFDGLIDEVKVFNRALSVDDIEKLYLSVQ